MVSTVGVPILVDGSIWGFMVAAAKPGRPIPSDVEQRLVRFTELGATAVSNATMRVKEWDGDVIFLHEVGPGAVRGQRQRAERRTEQRRVEHAGHPPEPAHRDHDQEVHEVLEGVAPEDRQDVGANRAANRRVDIVILNDATRLAEEPGAATDAAAPGSAAFGRKEPTIRRGALDEIGRNSVSPCTRPSRAASIQFTLRHHVMHPLDSP